MLRPFVGRFLLPLTTGGSLHVGRPLDLRLVTTLLHAWENRSDKRQQALLGAAEEHAANELSGVRTRRARALLFDLPPPAIDEATLRLGAAMHDVLALAHPGLAEEGAGRARIAEAAESLGDLGPPTTAEEAVRRHTLLARVPDIVQPERIVTYWLGKQRFVGRQPPARMLALPRLRRVKAEEVRRIWLREVGVAASARPAWLAIQRASPLGEALDPLRLDPPLSWSRLLTVLRFPALARAVAGRVLELGLVPAGSALAGALLAHAAVRPTPANRVSTPAGLAFGIRFVAHAFWLELLFGEGTLPDDGQDLGALLAAAAEVDPTLVFPPDISPSSELGQRLTSVLERWGATARQGMAERHRLCLDVSRHAAAASPEADPSGGPPALVAPNTIA